MRRVLVVDDEESIRTTFAYFLSKEGYQVETAVDFLSAKKVLSGTDVDLIFADILLGGYTGLDILRELKTRGLQCPVIVITGEPSLENAADAVRLGAFDFLVKPVPKSTLLRAARLGLDQKALVDERDQLEVEKERCRSNLEAIFRSVRDAIITVDKEMRVIEANEATERICGMGSREKIIGKEFCEAFCSCLRPCQEVLHEVLIHRNTVQEYRTNCGRHDGQEQVVVLTSSPLVDGNGGFAGAVLVIRDDTKLICLERELKERHRFHNILGKSRSMQEIYNLLEDLADVETTVLIIGESGTGKEMLAKALHYSGARSAKPLVVVNCSALAENVLESELFGHVKGAFTGAIRDRKGRFEAARGGTIVLDEIGEISPSIQLKLLRVLQEKEFERVGDSAPVRADVRVIAVTNQNLKEKLRLGHFRKDLYYRLKVVEIFLPPLRERLEDVPLLVDHFVGEFNKTFRKQIDGISKDVLRLFMTYPWPGNIRELRHAVECAFVLCHDSTILRDHLPSELREYVGSPEIESEKKPFPEPQELIEALEKTRWNKSKAADLLGVSRRTLYRKLAKNGLGGSVETV